jgi:hypothetical protein
MDQNEINNLLTSGNNMLRFVNDNLTYPNANVGANEKKTFLELLDSFSLKGHIQMDVVTAADPEVRDLIFEKEDIETGLEKLNDPEHKDDSLVYNLSDMLQKELNPYIKKLQNAQGDDYDFHSDDLDLALQNIVALFNVAIPNNNVAAGGAKKSRKSAKKSRKSAKKSRKSAKKSRKSAKKSARKH